MQNKIANILILHSQVGAQRCSSADAGTLRHAPIGANAAGYPSIFLPATRPHRSFLSIRLLEAIDVDFLHLHHRLHDVFRLRRIFVVKIIEKNRGGDLPGDAEFVSQPAAGEFLAAG